MSPEDEVNMDTEREARLGFDEAILSGSKSADQLQTILDSAHSRNGRLLLTRMEPEQVEALKPESQGALDYDPVSKTGFFGAPRDLDHGDKLRVAVVTAGSSDVPMAREASRTLAYYGEPCLEIFDVGVAGLHRLQERVDELRQMRVVIAVAGMDAALASVLGGLVPGLVVVVPTSVGYGVVEGGWTALRASLASCAPGIVVVNIDNGYGAACAALRSLGPR
ncbi:MAG: NCAIR mutase (PurE)-related protein [Bacteroidia bacterium]|jgi:NCAIR mutase (PurE)-related protein